nr:MAG: RNA-dependent RNA polymerase [Jingmen bat rhabdovirus 3]
MFLKKTSTQPIPEYILDSPLTLRNEKLFLGLEVDDRYVPPDISTIPEGQGLLLKEYKMWKSIRGVGASNIIKCFGSIRLNWEPEERYKRHALAEFKESLPDGVLIQDLLRSLGKCIHECQFGTSENTSPLDSEFTYDFLFKQLVEHFSDDDILTLFTKYLIFDEAIKWANISEETQGCAPEMKDGEEHYGWTGNNDPEISGISQWITCQTGNQDVILLNVLTYSIGLLIDMGEEPKLYVAPKSLLLSERDLYYQRWLTLLMCRVFETVKLLKLPSSSIVKKLYRWGDQVLNSMGNIGYDVLKEFESFFVARTQHLLEKDQATALSDLFWSFINQAIKDLLEEANLIHLYYDLQGIARKLTFSEALEVSGLFRHWGHPLIEVEDGLTSIHDNSSKTLPENPSLVKTLASMLSALVLRNYYFKHLKRWPPNTYVVNPSSWAELTLKNYIDNNEFPSEEQQMNLGEAWLRVEHPKLVEDLDEIPPSTLIQDKRHAKDRDEISSILKGTRTYLKSASASVIETYLQTPRINVLAFLREVDEKGISRKYLIIVLKEKERELKRKGRFFSLMTFILRLYFVSTEWLIEHYILPLFPEITMCKDQLEFTQQLLNSSEKDQYQEGVTHHMISIDFEKWNNFQREGSTRPVFEVIDKYFGYKRVVSRTHEIFSQTTVLYGGALHKIPSNLETCVPYCWNDHLGGFEGLRQKGWSVVGALLIRLVSIQHRLKTNVLLQGDNQVIIIRYNMPKGLSNTEFVGSKARHCRITQRFMESFSDSCGSIGLKTKPEETWMSAHLLYYGKIAIIDGTVQSLFLKRICRSLFLTNEVAPALSNSLGSLNTALLSSAYQIHDPMICYTIYMFLGALCVGYYMRFDPIISSSLYDAIVALRENALDDGLTKSHRHLVKTSQEMLKRLTVLPRWSPLKSPLQTRLLFDILIRDASLGGIGGAGWLRYMVRQFPDPVTESLAGAKLLHTYLQSDFLKHFFSDLGYPRLSKSVNYEILVQDPTSLNLMGSTKCTNILRSHVKELFLRNRTQVVANDMVREALAMEISSRPAFLDFLMSIRPVFPRFLSELYSASPLALSESITNKITNTRSAFRMTSRLGSIKTLREKLFTNEILLISNVLIHWPQEIRSIWTCSTTRAQELRTEGWKLTITGMTVPHPSEQWGLVSKDKYNTCGCSGFIHQGNYLLLVPDDEMRNSPELSPWVKGSFSPYLGGHTKQKRIAQSEIELDTSSSLIKNIVRLYNCSNWAFQDRSVLQRCITKIMSSYVPGCEEFLYNMIDITSGNLIHRFGSSRISDGAVLGVNPNLSSHSCISSNFLTSLGRGEENYVIMFQAVFIYFQLVYGLRVHARSIQPYSVHIHPSCAGCFILAPDFELSTSNLISLPPVTALLSYDAYEGPGFKASIPEKILWKRNPFEVDLSQIYLSPISLTASSNELENPSSSDIEEAVYTGVAICALCKIDFLSDLRALTSYQLSVSLLRVLSWGKLKEYLIRLSVIFTYLHLRKDIIRDTRSKDETWNLVKRYTINSWSRVVNNSFGMLLANSGLDTKVLQEPVAHNASFPAKNAHIGHSGINSLIGDLMSLRNSPSWLKLIIPGDLNSGGVIGMLSTGLVIQSYVLGDLSIDNVERRVELFENGLTILSRVSIPEFLEQKREILKVLNGMIHPYIPIYYIRKDLKSLSTQLEAQEENSSKPMKYLTPSREIVRASSICWQTGWTLLKENADNHNPGTKPVSFISPLMHVFRPIWHSANGSVKIMSILKVLPPGDLKYPAMIGDGNGGFSRVLNYYPHVSKLWFNSLPELNGLTDQQGASAMPSAIASIPANDCKVINLRTCLEGVNDLLDPQWPDSVQRQWKTAGFLPTIIISDAEFYGAEKMVQLIKNLYRLIPVCSSNVIKMHLNGSLDLRFFFSSYLFGFMQILRSPYSHLGKDEVYVYVRWRNSHGDMYSERDIPNDCALSSDEKLFHSTISSHFQVLDEYTYPVRDRLERIAVLKTGLSLRRNIARSLNLPIASLIELEKKTAVQDITPLQCFLHLIEILYSHKHSFTLYILENTDAYGSNKVCRSRCVAWAGAVIASSIFLTGLLRDYLNYQFSSSYYKYGCVLHHDKELNMVYLDNKREPKGLFEFSYIELKPYIHETIRYLASIWWLSGNKHFKISAVNNRDRNKCYQHLSEMIQVSPDEKGDWTYIHPYTCGTFDTVDATPGDNNILDLGS